MVQLKDLTVQQFAAVTASDAPAPGGGSVSALVAALGAALAEMVANLTIGKEKYASAQEEMQHLAKKAADLRTQLIDAIQKDTESFTAYMTALKMPKDTDEEKSVRREAMQQGLKEAAAVPMEVAQTTMEIFPIALAVVERGNPNAVTDGLVAAMLARSAVLGALLNVKINLDSIKDEAFVAAMSAQVKHLEAQAISLEKQVLCASRLTDKVL